MKQTPFARFQPDLLLHDGPTLDEYGLAATVVHTPGHTAGSIALATTTGHIFAGDPILNRIKPGIAPFAQDFQAVRSSFFILQQLSGELTKKALNIVKMNRAFLKNNPAAFYSPT